MLDRRIEEASLNAWPALQQILFDGWILRFAAGYTKRANSVNPLFASHIDLEEKVAFCEAAYADKGLAPIFRLTPFSTPPALDPFLARRGYDRVDPTSVLHLDLRQYIAQPAKGTANLHDRGIDDWLNAYGAFVASSPQAQQTHRQMLQVIPGRRFLACLLDGTEIVACGLGVVEGEYLGLFDLIADPRRRGQGYGSQLIQGLLAWGRHSGASHAYLQVMVSNVPARRLYERLGFAELYGYWYRVRPLPGHGDQ